MVQRDDTARGDADHEDSGERANRELIELLNELRVALPGVQVLFAFLLTLPFMDRFDRLDATDRRVYFTALIAALAASMLLIAPAAHHRLRFRAGVKEDLLRLSTVLTVAGLTLLAISMTASAYLIAELLYSTRSAALVAAALAIGFLVMWYVVPFAYRSQERTPPA